MRKIVLICFSVFIIILICLFFIYKDKIANDNYSDFIENNSSLVCYWDFSGKEPLMSKGRNHYLLRNDSIEIEFTEDGPVSGKAIKLDEGDFLYVPRNECGELNLYGKDAEVTVLAWVNRNVKSYEQCEAIAGMWNETMKLRQYCLFLNIMLYDSKNQVSGHISGVGGATPGNKWCVDVAIGNAQVNYDEWTFVGFTYDAKQIKSYYNGRFEERVGLNPYNYDLGIYDGGEFGSDFTVGAVHRLGEMGNFFVGKIGFIAVYNKALTENEILEIYNNTKNI